MYLSESLRKKYTKETLTAREAQRQAEFIAFGPIVFQVSRLMVKWGILEMLRDETLTIEEILVDEETNRFTISKTGWFLLNDPATRVNIDFNHDVNYEGLYRLEESLKEGRPAGLEHFGNWPTVYEGLSQLPEQAQKSWFAFDHFYSDSSFEEALEIVFAHHPKTLMDVGGNTGRWAMQCVNHDKEVHVTIVDLPQQLEMMRKQTTGKDGADRIHGFGTNLLDRRNPLPQDQHYDAIWMSQFLDCFGEDEIESILERAAQVMDDDTTLYIMETLWDRQKYEPAAFCLTQISLYFTDIANGNSKMYHSEDLIRIIEKVGLQVKKIHDNLGQGHSIIEVKKK